jgi:hypothetical protein
LAKHTTVLHGPFLAPLSSCDEQKVVCCLVSTSPLHAACCLVSAACCLLSTLSCLLSGVWRLLSELLSPVFCCTFCRAGPKLQRFAWLALANSKVDGVRSHHHAMSKYITFAYQITSGCLACWLSESCLCWVSVRLAVWLIVSIFR